MKNKEKYSVFISSLMIVFLIAILGYITFSSINIFNLNYKHQIIRPPVVKEIYPVINYKTNVEVKYYEIKYK